MVRSTRIACLGSFVTLPALLSWPAGASEPVYHDHGPGDHPAPPPLSERLHVPDGPLADGEGHTLFVNFDGPTLVELGYDDSTQNSTQFPGMGGPYQPFGEAAGGPMREGILQAVRQDLAAFQIEVTDVRPEGSAYTMIVVSPTNGQPGKLGFASLHCGGSNGLGVGFAFFTATQGRNVVEMATTVTHEAAHTLGIEHVTNVADIMYPTSGNGTATFVDACTPIDGPEYCGAAHQVYCPAGQQNTFAELAGLLGEQTDPDTEGPAVELIAPVEGEHFEIGEMIEFIAEASDDLGVQQVRLMKDGDLLGTDLTAPWTWHRDNLPDGVYTFSVVAEDGGGNVAESDEVTIAVGDAEVPDPPDDGGDGDSEGPELGGGDAGIDGEGEGCACNAASPAPGVGGLVLLVGLCGLRRRSRVSA